MKRHLLNRPCGPNVIRTAGEEFCVDCAKRLPVYQRDGRWVDGLAARFRLVYRDKRCMNPDCPGEQPLIKAYRDPRIVLPGRIYGLDVTMHVGERHASDGIALAQITRDLEESGLKLDQRHTGRIFRDYVALAKLRAGDEEAVRERLRRQGGVVLMFDGVQFENRSPVLYIAWDALSGKPLYGERMPRRGAEDLVPLLERVRAMDVDVIGIVTDKETGLVPAVARVFPGVPYQYCQTHFLKNSAKPLRSDLQSLQASVERREKAIVEIANQISRTEVSDGGAGHVPDKDDDGSAAGAVDECQANRALESSTDTSTLSPSDVELAKEFCELARANSRVSGKAPLDPPELKRHERLEDIRQTIIAVKKNAPI